MEVDRGAGRRRARSAPRSRRAAAASAPAAGFAERRPRRTRRPRPPAPAPARRTSRRAQRARGLTPLGLQLQDAGPRGAAEHDGLSVISPIVPAPSTTARFAGPPSVARPPDAHGVDAVRQRLGQHGAPRVGAVGSARSRSSGTRTGREPAWPVDPISSRRCDSCSIRRARPHRATSGLTATPRPRQAGSTPAPSADTRRRTRGPSPAGASVGLPAAVALEAGAADPRPRRSEQDLARPGLGSGSSSTDIRAGPCHTSAPWGLPSRLPGLRVGLRGERRRRTVPHKGGRVCGRGFRAPHGGREGRARSGGWSYAGSFAERAARRGARGLRRRARVGSGRGERASGGVPERRRDLGPP